MVGLIGITRFAFCTHLLADLNNDFTRAARVGVGNFAAREVDATLTASSHPVAHAAPVTSTRVQHGFPSIVEFCLPVRFDGAIEVSDAFRLGDSPPTSDSARIFRRDNRCYHIN